MVVKAVMVPPSHPGISLTNAMISYIHLTSIFNSLGGSAPGAGPRLREPQAVSHGMCTPDIRSNSISVCYRTSKSINLRHWSYTTQLVIEYGSAEDGSRVS